MPGAYEMYRTHVDARRYRDAATLARTQAEASAAPDQKAFWLTRQAVALSRSGDHEAALRVAQQALVVKSNDPFAVYASGEALAGLGRHAEAIPRFEEASRETRLRQRALERILDSLEATARWEELLRRLEAAGLAAGDALVYRAEALAGLGRVEDALDTCRRCLEQAPHLPRALWLRVDLEVRTEGLEPVLDRYRRMARIPSLPPVYREIHASLARKAGRDEEALKEYESLGGQDRRAQKKRAFTLAKTGHENEAIPLLEELLRAEPRDMYLHSSYGAACRRTGQLERALSFYNALIGLHPDEKTLYGRAHRLRRALESA